MASVYTLDLPKRKSETWFICSDTHTDKIDEQSFKIMCDKASDLPKSKRNLVILGDFVDAKHLMPRNPDYKLWINRAEGNEQYFVPESDIEIAWANDRLDKIQKVFSRVVYLFGNHCGRYQLYQKANKQCEYNHNFDLPLRLELEKRKIMHLDYPDWLDFGPHLTFNHGIFHSTTAPKKHYEASGSRSVIHGHLHKTQCTPFFHRGNTNHVWSMPCMSTMNPEYIKSGVNNWTLGFGELVMRNDGIFWFQVHNVWDNELRVGNKVYRGS